jgi:hypothetical protein
MTAEEFITKLNNEYGMKPWPIWLEVDHETYANCCQYVFHKMKEGRDLYFNWEGFENRVSVAIGPNEGLMFKNIELRLK